MFRLFINHIRYRATADTSVTTSSWVFEPPNVPNRVPSLDGLRAVSIVFVLLAHLVETKHFPEILRPMGHLGNYGVRFFFIISGFLITTLLLKELSNTGNISLKAFYLRRALRILPAYYFYIIVIFILSLVPIITLHSGDMLHALTYTMNYQNVPVGEGSARANAWYMNHIWSLSVEEQFYLLWPAVLCLLGPRKALISAATVIALSPLIRLGMWYRLSSMPWDIYTTAATRQFEAVSDVLATGCVLAGAYNWLGRRQRYLDVLQSDWFLVLPISGILSSMVMFLVNEPLFYIVGQTVATMSLALCVDRYVRVPSGWVAAILSSRIMVYIGVLSYSLYLWQELFLNSYKITVLTTFPQNLILTVVAALVCHYTVEKWFLRLKHRLSARVSEPRLPAPVVARQNDCPVPGGQGTGLCCPDETLEATER